jgi:hypothetical protein
MWNLKTIVIALMIETIAAIPKSFIKYVKDIPGKHDLKEVH